MIASGTSTTIIWISLLLSNCCCQGVLNIARLPETDAASASSETAGRSAREAATDVNRSPSLHFADHDTTNFDSGNNRPFFTGKSRLRRNTPGLPLAEDIGPDTCGKDRRELSKWFISHGSPDLLEEPIPSLVSPTASNPYEDPSNPPPDPNGYCAVKWSSTFAQEGNRRYWLKNFATEDEAIADGFTVTHKGHCASCSTLQDLGVYMGKNLTEPVRRCAILGMFSDRLMTRCLQNVGFSKFCLPIWKYNIMNTATKCFYTCLWSWFVGEPYNLPDGSLNDCLQCDEDKSGPNFKYFAGRTRRNSGIPSSIHRPPNTVFNISHCYWYGQLLTKMSQISLN